ncbi:cadherin-related family member 5-like isoform X8 [Scyliorhinus torazame]|uniref:cadherin-related family member 5-like isoform X8 n=1 Tax=Scyliorhinus torazame TaxID=75743 RepID=UPI003B5BBD5E
MDSSLTLSVPRNVLFILLAALQLNSAAEVCSFERACCVPEKHVRVDENNRVGFVVSTITINQEPVRISNPANTPDVAVVGQSLLLTKSIDFENLKSPVMLVLLQCGPAQQTLEIVIQIINVNDNPATFPQSVLNFTISEFFPVNETWKTEKANDPDGGLIFYTLDPNTDGAEYFRLKTANTPDIILSKAIDYEKTTSLQLILSATDNQTDPSRTDELTINISVLDEDNKPPVFEPCSPVPGSTANICFNAAYTGNITQNKTETGPLQLDPQQIQAVDGDKGINATIRYRIIAGDHENAFIMNPNTGAITMTKVATSLNLIVLTVMAYQENDHYKFSTTTVSLKVLRVNQCRPKFTREIYNGNIQENSEAKSIVIGQGTTTKPLEIQAEDCDFPDKINPSIKYEITPNDIFTINRDGLILTKTEIPAGFRLYELMVTATDGENGETAAAKVNVQVISSNAPTTVKTTTTAHGSGTPKPPPKPPGTGPTTTGASTPSKAPPGPPGSTTTKSPGTGPTTTKPQVTGSITTNDPGPPGSIPPSGNPPDGPGTGPTTSLPAVNPRLIYEAKHMAALGVPLGILLIICFVIIGILLHKIHRWNMEWEQITDGSVTKLKALSRGLFSSENDKLQFSNEGYQEEETSENAQKSSWPRLDNPVVESVALAAILDPTVENSDPTGSSGNHTDPVSQRSKAAATNQEDHKASGSFSETDTDTEVKSILTKERKSDEGYKSVWFKEDIELEANEEHVIERHDGEENDDNDRDKSFVQLESDDQCSINL